MLIKNTDQFYEKKEEPIKSCLLALRSFILNYDSDITEVWKYSMPFFCLRGIMFCYLWTHKKNGQPYIGIVEGGKIEHPDLIQENRTRMKIMMIDPNKDLPVKKIVAIFKLARQFYK